MSIYLCLSYCLCQQNVSLLEAEEKTMEQLGIEDGNQILIEGNQCTDVTAISSLAMSSLGGVY